MDGRGSGVRLLESDGGEGVIEQRKTGGVIKEAVEVQLIGSAANAMKMK